MPRITAQNPKTKKWEEVEDEIDVATGKSLAKEGLTKAKIPFKVSERLVHKKTKEVVDVPEEELSEALGTGEFDIEALAEAKGPDYEKAQVGKFGEVGPSETALRNAIPFSDEIGGAAKNVSGAIKTGLGYIGLGDSTKTDDDMKEYKAERDMNRARKERGSEEYPEVAITAGITGAAATPGLGAASLPGKIAAGAAEGVIYSASEDDSDSVYNEGVATGTGVGAAIPVVGQALKFGGKVIKNNITKNGEQYLDNTAKLNDDIGARDRAVQIQDDIKLENQTMKERIQPIQKAETATKEQIDAEQLARQEQVGKYESEIDRTSQLKDVISTSATNKEFEALTDLKAKQIETRNKLLETKSTLSKKQQDELALLDNDIAATNRKIAETKEAGELDTRLFEEDATKKASGDIARRMADADEIINTNSNKRAARIENLKDFPLKPEAKYAYLGLRESLKRQVGSDKSDEAIVALKRLDEFLPVENIDNLSQGEVLDRLLTVKKDLFDSTKNGMGYGYKNFNQKSVAREVDNAFKNSGEPEIVEYTKAMGPAYGVRDILRENAAKRVGDLTEGGFATKVYTPDPLKAERAMDVTKEAMGRAGYLPTLKKEVAEVENKHASEIKKLKLDLSNLKLKKVMVGSNKVDNAPEIAELQTKIRDLEIMKNNVKKEAHDAMTEVNNLDNRVTVLRGLIKSTKNAPIKMQQTLDELVKKREMLMERVKDSNLRANRRFLEEIEKVRAIGKFTSNPNLIDAGIDGAVDAASFVLPGGVGMAARKGIGVITDPVNKMKAFNAVRKAYNKPGLTAALRILAMKGGKGIRRETIETLAQQHNVDAAELERLMAEPDDE